ncbi:MATH domain-containing protein [Hibiscus syriacus]|uniref:MATH domain-containing protein n=1 Tax=Hibiscus syriacus TaxID=106335 RepID=A0A6A2Z8U6_HIBSY|nr:TNF receptor-associated factor homolog 1b-like isoform X2 [Hibiscus syriacus]KAE8688391.1 MATH domain-containing protein [Hibiscus syriacus]
MAAVESEESGVGRSVEGISSGQRCQAGEALAEWRSSEQLENGTPSTSPPYWDSDDDDGGGGSKPSELYGKYTWKIEKFSQINKRELRSNAFEVGGYKWYILIYPQGCDVCNHLSLFLCVANHDKLLPGWSHFAQFTIAVVNKDPKKSKYSDTLHRFWKKEHDWGWKKFMELSKVYDGFIESDTLIIKAQVQVIREKADRPFRCLDCQYKRELVRVYLTNVEQICGRFLDERQQKLVKLIEDKASWSSFCAFWLGIDQNARRRMSREKTDVILKVVVKHFFIEKEVTSTLVMDSLYSGLKALEGQSKGKKAKSKLLDAEEMPAPIVHVEKDMFLLVDDVLLLLERAALEPLPPKDDKGPQNRTKDGNSGEDFNKDSIERDERHLMELGRRTVEIFVLSHIFSSKIEVAYQEAVALKRQEELIREEAAWLAESEQKAKRAQSEKEKKSKKKQAKQKRNNRKSKDKGREEKAIVAAQEKHQEDHPNDEKEASVMGEQQPVPEKVDVLGDVSDVSDSVDAATEVLPPDSEDRDASPVNWDTDTSEIHPPTEACTRRISGLSCVQNEVTDRRSPSLMDDSSSTCSADSVPSVVMNGPYKGNSFSNHNKKSLSRGRNQRSKTVSDGSSWTTASDNRPSCTALDAGHQHDVSGSSKAGESESEPAVSSSDLTKWSEQDTARKEVLPQKKPSTQGSVDLERPEENTAAVPSSPRSPSRNLPSSVQFRSEYRSAGSVNSMPVRKTSSKCLQQSDKSTSSTISIQITDVLKSETQKAAAPKPIEKHTTPQVPVMSRPSSSPLIPGSRPIAPVVSMVQTTPLLARTVSAVGRLGPDPSPAASYVPQSYRNAIMGNHNVTSSSAGFKHSNSPSSAVNPLPVYSQPPTFVSTPMYMPQSSERMEANSIQSGIPFGMVTRETFRNAPHWMESFHGGSNRSMHSDPSLLGEIENLDLYKSVHKGSRDHFAMEFPACASGRQTQGVLADEFPHLDIINELLDEEHNVSRAGAGFPALCNGSYLLNQHSSFTSDLAMSDEMRSSSGSCRFDHDDRFQPGYCSSSGNHFDTPRECIPQASPPPYAASGQQIDGLVPTGWQMASTDQSLLGMRNGNGESYPYYSPEYSSIARGINGYTVFRPSNGL